MANGMSPMGKGAHPVRGTSCKTKPIRGAENACPAFAGASLLRLPRRRKTSGARRNASRRHYERGPSCKTKPIGGYLYALASPQGKRRVGRMGPSKNLIGPRGRVLGVENREDSRFRHGGFALLHDFAFALSRCPKKKNKGRKKGRTVLVQHMIDRYPNEVSDPLRVRRYD